MFQHNFVNYQDLAETIMLGRAAMPAKIDLVVGIPRSGMLAASMLAAQLNAPLTDVEGLKQDRLFGYGATKSAPNVKRALSDDRTVLIIDDIAGAGSAIRRTREDIAQAGVRGTIVFCVVYAPTLKHPDIDVVLKQTSPGLMAPWNIMHHKVLARACVDIDGVLCRNPFPHEDDDGAAYETFLKTTEPLHGVSGRIGWLVTSRKERYRAATEEWLARHGIEYDELHMTTTPEEKQDSPAFKARLYRETGAELFIESEGPCALRIAELSERNVMCVSAQTMITPDGADSLAHALSSTGRKAMMRTLVSRAKLSARQVLGPKSYAALKSIARRG
ncbi:MAG: phosphoribosyltransferase family protein [Pseudomonadota bacterium]